MSPIAALLALTGSFDTAPLKLLCWWVMPLSKCLAGTGEQVPVGQPVTIRGLRTNDNYVFAVAAYTAEGDVIGSLGDSSPQLLVAHALPLYSCWAQLLLTAYQLDCPALGKQAAHVLLPHFIAKLAVRPAWQANPMDCFALIRWVDAASSSWHSVNHPSCSALACETACDRIKLFLIHSQQHTLLTCPVPVCRSRVQAAAKPLIRAVVQAVYAHVLYDTQLAAKAAAEAVPPQQSSAERLASPALPQQVEALRSTKKVLMAMEVRTPPPLDAWLFVFGYTPKSA